LIRTYSVLYTVSWIGPLVAFAEVTSFVRHLADSGPPDSLPKLLAELRSGAGFANGRLD